MVIILPMNDELLSRLYNHEDGFVERKPENCNDRELRKEFVAFANSVPEGSYGVIFLGVADSGEPLGVQNPDERQKRLRRVAENDCYPPIPIQMYVLENDGHYFIAVVIEHSVNKPHFAGPAYVRTGSECVNATPEQYEALINSRNDKCRFIENNKGLIFTVIVINKKLGSTKQVGRCRASHECSVEECNQHFIRLRDIGSWQSFSEPLENVEISRDEEKYRPMLIVQAKS